MDIGKLCNGLKHKLKWKTMGKIRKWENVGIYRLRSEMMTIKTMIIMMTG